MTSGVHIRTDGPVPAAGTVGILTVMYIDGHPHQLPPELLPVERIAAWRGYSVDIHGGHSPDSELPHVPTWDIFEDDGTPRHSLALDRIRVRADGSALFAELVALPLPGRPIRTAIFGWERGIPPQAEIDAAVYGLKLIGLIKDLNATRSPGGRPERYSPANEPQFFAALNTAAHAAVRNGEPVNYSSLARHGVGSRATITAAVKRFDYDLPALEAEAVRCTERLSICTVLWRRRTEFKKKRG